MDGGWSGPTLMFYASYILLLCMTPQIQQHYSQSHAASISLRLSQFHTVFWAAWRHLMIYDEPGGLLGGNSEACAHAYGRIDMNSYMHALSHGAYRLPGLLHAHWRSSVFGIGNLFHLTAAPRLWFCWDCFPLISFYCHASKTLTGREAALGMRVCV